MINLMILRKLRDLRQVTLSRLSINDTSSLATRILLGKNYLDPPKVYLHTSVLSYNLPLDMIIGSRMLANYTVMIPNIRLLKLDQLINNSLYDTGSEILVRVSLMISVRSLATWVS